MEQGPMRDRMFATVGRPNEGRAPTPWLEVIAFDVAVRIIRGFIATGRVQFALRDEHFVEVGDGTGPLYRMRVASVGVLYRILRDPDLAFGETFMEGRWRLESGDLAKFIGLLFRNQQVIRRTPFFRFYAWLNGRKQRRGHANDPARSRTNAAHHYDIGNDLYEAFLDEGMNYSCAFFEYPEQSLRDAQLHKLRTTISRLAIAPNDSVLDIGCGWGEMTRTIARETDAAHITGITLADRQVALAREKIPPEYDGRLRYIVEDYRLHAAENPGRYDRVVSVGMFEHVGRRQFDVYFAMIHTLLAKGGRAVVHSIIRPDRKWVSPWIDKYIFPGGEIPLLDEMVASARRAGLELVHAPFIHEGSNYARTLKLWRERFNEAWQTLDTRKYDVRFRRMWNFYLCSAQACFEADGFANAQLVLRKPT